MRFCLGILSLPESYFGAERQIKELKWKKEKKAEDIKREQTLINNAKVHLLFMLQVLFCCHFSYWGAVCVNSSSAF